MQIVIRPASYYLRMIKFSHSLFALPFAGVALIEVLRKNPGILGDPYSLARILGGVLLCMISMRSAAMGFNRIVDRHFDAQNPRTAGRELPAGIITVRSAVFFVTFFLVLFVLGAFMIQPLAGFLSPIPILITLGYSYTKRITWLCHLSLGLALGLVPPAVWVAVTGTISLEPILWMAGITFYTAGFDILYACQDLEFDQSRGLHSVPVRFGLHRALQIARGAHVLSFLAFVAVADVARTGTFFAATLGLIGFLFYLQHWLVRGGRLDRIPIAFFHVNAAISATAFLGLLADRLLF